MDNMKEILEELEEDKKIVEECDKLYNELQEAIELAKRLEE